MFDNNWIYFFLDLTSKIITICDCNNFKCWWKVAGVRQGWCHLIGDEGRRLCFLTRRDFASLEALLKRLKDDPSIDKKELHLMAASAYERANKPSRIITQMRRIFSISSHRKLILFLYFCLAGWNFTYYWWFATLCYRASYQIQVQ